MLCSIKLNLVAEGWLKVWYVVQDYPFYSILLSSMLSTRSLNHKGQNLSMITMGFLSYQQVSLFIEET